MAKKRKKLIPKHQPIDPIRAAREVVEAIGETLTPKNPRKRRSREKWIVRVC